MIQKYFYFLAKLGFKCVSQSMPVRYEHPDWYIEVWLGNGDDEILLGNKLTSKLTTLQQIIRTHHKGPFPLLADFPKIPNTNQNEHYLAYASHWLKTYLPNIIEGK
jgi:hypothetical protein